jgi:hypothetical protein
VHEAGIQGAIGSFGDQIQHAYTESAHSVTLIGGTANSTRGGDGDEKVAVNDSWIWWG